MTALRGLQHLLEDAFRVPGARLRFGWDPIIGLVRWQGDVLTAVFSSAIVLQADHMRVPGVVQMRMVMNVAIDVIAGALRFVGDVADLFWKSNARNFDLLERHAAEPQPASTADWLFVLGMIAIVVLTTVIPLVVLYLIVNALAHFSVVAR